MIVLGLHPFTHLRSMYTVEGALWNFVLLSYNYRIMGSESRTFREVDERNCVSVSFHVLVFVVPIKSFSPNY